MTRTQCTAWAGMAQKPGRCRNTTAHPAGTCSIHRRCGVPGCKRYAGAETDELKPRCYEHKAVAG